MNVLQLLDYAQVSYDANKEQDNVYIECPYCTENKLSINIHTGAWHCWYGACGRKGHVTQLARDEFGVEDMKFEAAPQPERVREFNPEDREAILSAITNKAEVIKWAVSRSLDPDHLFKRGIGYDDKHRAIVIPFYDAQGELVGAKYRGDNGDQWIKGNEPDLYVLDPSVLKQDRVVIVEGEVDAITLDQFGLPVVATLGAGKTKGFESLRRVKQLYLGYDMDSAGLGGVEKAVVFFGHYRCKRIEWTSKDPNDMLKAGATKDDIIRCLANAKLLLKESRSISGDDALKEFVVNQKKQTKNRISWGYPRLDSFTKGIGGGMWMALLAEAGTGKTTFILNATRNMMEMGVNVGICSLEEQNVMEVTPKLTAMHIGRNPGGGEFHTEEVERAEPFMKKVKLYEGDETKDDVIEWIKECYYAHDVRVIFIDYLQLLFADEKNTEQVKKDCYSFKRLVRKECPDLCIVAIVQPKQKQKLLTREGVVSNESLDGSDARSGSAINQSVDAFLTMRAVKGHSNLTQLEYTKVRGHLRVSKKDWLQLFTQLEYDHGTLRQTEVTNISYGG